MKTLMNMLALLLAMLCASCEKGDGNLTTLYVVIDLTSKERTVPDYGTIEAELGLSDNSRGALFKITSIEDIDYSSIVRHELAPEHALLQNPPARRRDVDAFLADVHSSLDSFKNIQGDRPTSSVYARVAMLLNDLSKHSGRKVMYVCSDLVENDRLKLYGGKDLDTLYGNFSEIEKWFTSTQPLGDLTGVTVVFCYVPKDAQDNRRYRALLKVYADLIHARHGSVRMDGFDNLATEKP